MVAGAKSAGNRATILFRSSGAKEWAGVWASHWRLRQLTGIIFGGGPSQKTALMTDVTRIPPTIEEGDAQAAEWLLPWCSAKF